VFALNRLAGLGAEQGPFPKPGTGFVGQDCAEFARMAEVYERLARKSDKKQSTRDRAAQYAKQEWQWYQECLVAKGTEGALSAPSVPVATGAQAVPVAPVIGAVEGVTRSPYVWLGVAGAVVAGFILVALLRGGKRR
jgi:hypothetical protein